jgi:hypothetical protein
MKLEEKHVRFDYTIPFVMHYNSRERATLRIKERPQPTPSVRGTKYLRPTLAIVMFTRPKGNTSIKHANGGYVNCV